MGWLPSWLSQESKEKDDNHANKSLASNKTPQGAWENNLNSVDWTHYTSPQAITASIFTTAATFALVKLYKTYLRRIPTSDFLKPGFFRRRSLYGYVSSVGDGDNFRLFHTPGGRLAGWGWLPGRHVKEMHRKDFKDKTLSIRLAGIDAPEMPHFGRPGQPYSQEALDWLREFVLNRYVRVYPYKRDQYERIVCTVYRKRWLFFNTDVGHQMIKRGLATVYDAKVGSEFGGKEDVYKSAESRAKSKKVGMWQEPGLVSKILGAKSSTLETPRQFKTRMAESDKSSSKPKPGK